MSFLKSTICLQARNITRTFSCTPTVYGTRLERGLPHHRNAESILTDGPDFTYLDGRPTPLLRKQKIRMLRQRELASKIVEMCSELDFAKERHQKMQQAEEQERQNIIANRLKPKGATMNKKN